MDLIRDTPFRPNVVIDVQGKGFFRRAFAYLVDWAAMYSITYAVNCVVTFFLSVIVLIIGTLFRNDFYFSPSEPNIIGYIISIPLNILYFTAFEGLYQKTLGKIVFRMGIIDLEGGPITFQQAWTRAYWRLIDGLFAGLVAAFNMASPFQQRIGDKKAMTIVVSAQDARRNPGQPWWKFFLALGIYMIFIALIHIFRLLFTLRFG